MGTKLGPVISTKPRNVHHCSDVPRNRNEGTTAWSYIASPLSFQDGIIFRTILDPTTHTTVLCRPTTKKELGWAYGQRHGHVHEHSLNLHLDPFILPICSPQLQTLLRPPLLTLEPRKFWPFGIAVSFSTLCDHKVFS